MTPPALINALVPASAQPATHDVIALVNLAAAFIVFVVLFSVIRLRRERNRIMRRTLAAGLIASIVGLATAVANAVLTFRG